MPRASAGALFVYDTKDVERGKWINLLADSAFVTTQYHQLTPYSPQTKPRPGEEKTALHADFHASMVDFDIKMDEAGRHALLADWRKQIESFSLKQSSFACLFDMRYAILRKLLGSMKTKQDEEEALGGGFQSSSFRFHALGGGSADSPAVDGLIDPSLLGDVGTDPSLWGRDPAALLQALAPLDKLALRRQLLSPRKLQAFFASSLASLASSPSPSSGQSPVSASLLAAALSLGDPGCLLSAVHQLLVASASAPSPLTAVRAAQLTLPLQHLEQHLAHLNLSLPWKNALLTTFSPNKPTGAVVASLRSKSSSGSSVQPLSLACDGTHLFVHSKRGLLKLGTGRGGVAAGKRMVHREFRKDEAVSLCFCKGKLYALSSRSEWPLVEVLSPETLQTEGLLRLGTDPEEGCPQRMNHGQVLVTDGSLLYLFHVRPVEDKSAEGGVGGEAAGILQEISQIRERVRVEKEKLRVAKEMEGRIVQRQQRQEQELKRQQRERHSKLAELKQLEAHMTRIRRVAQEARSSSEGSEGASGSSGGGGGGVDDGSGQQAEEEKQASGNGEDKAEAHPTGSSSGAGASEEAGGAALVGDSSRFESDLDRALMEEIEHDYDEGAGPGASDGEASAAQPPIHMPAPELLEEDRSNASAPSSPSSPSASDSAVPPAQRTMRELLLQKDKKAGEGERGGGSGLKVARAVTQRTFVYVYDPSVVETDPSWLSPSEPTAAEMPVLFGQAAAAAAAAADGGGGDGDGDGGDADAEGSPRQRLHKKALQVSDSFLGRYSPRLCLLALLSSGQDCNSAARWLLDHGEAQRVQPRTPLVRRIVLQDPVPDLTDVPSTSHSFYSSSSSARNSSSPFASLSSRSPAAGRAGKDISTNAGLLRRSVVYATGTRLVVLTPAHVAPWSDNMDLVRCYSARDGSLRELQTNKLDLGGISSGGQSSDAACVDPANQTLWTARRMPNSSPSSASPTLKLSQFRCHGPPCGPPFPSGGGGATAESGQETKQDEVSRNVRNAESSPLSSSPSAPFTTKDAAPSPSSSAAKAGKTGAVLTAYEALGRLPGGGTTTELFRLAGEGAGAECYDVALLVLAHLDRLLLHLPISNGEARPLAAMRTQLENKMSRHRTLKRELVALQKQIERGDLSESSRHHSHPLEHRGRQSGWSCDVCHTNSARMAGSTTRWRCTEGCDWDICSVCFKKEGGGVGSPASSSAPSGPPRTSLMIGRGRDPFALEGEAEAELQAERQQALQEREFLEVLTRAHERVDGGGGDGDQGLLSGLGRLGAGLFGGGELERLGISDLASFVQLRRHREGAGAGGSGGSSGGRRLGPGLSSRGFFGGSPPPSSSSTTSAASSASRAARQSRVEQLKEDMVVSQQAIDTLSASMASVKERLALGAAAEQDGSGDGWPKEAVERAAVHPFVLDLCPQTFLALETLLYFCAQHRFSLPFPPSSSPASPEATAAATARRDLTYVAAVCLRMLKTHMTLFLHSVHSVAFSPSSPSSSAPSGKGAEAQALPGVVRLRDTLLAMALGGGGGRDKGAGAEDELKALRGLACDAITCGIQLFYPEKEARAALLSDLLAGRGAKVGGGQGAHAGDQLLQGVLGWFAQQRHVASLLLPPEPGRCGGDGVLEVQRRRRQVISRLVACAKDQFLQSTEPELVSSSVSPGNDLPPALQLLLALLRDVVYQSGLLRLRSKPRSALARAASSALPSSRPAFGGGGDKGSSSSSSISGRGGGSVQAVRETEVHLLLYIVEQLLDACHALVTEALAHKRVATGAAKKEAAAANRDSPSSSSASASPADDASPPLSSPSSKRFPLQRLQRSLLVLLPCVLPALSSPALMSRPALLAPLATPVQRLYRALDRLNLAEPEARREDIKYGCFLGSEAMERFSLETPHPYPSGVRVLKRTLRVPGATHLAFSFDSRSCSTNSSDSLRFFSDVAMARPLPGLSLSGHGPTGNWPRGTLLIPGQQVTVCFSAKTPPKPERLPTRWGFKCSVRGVTARSLPWLLDAQATLAAFAGKWASCLLRARGAALSPLHSPGSFLASPAPSQAPSPTASPTAASYPPGGILAAASVEEEVGTGATPPPMLGKAWTSLPLLSCGLEEFTSSNSSSRSSSPSSLSPGSPAPSPANLRGLAVQTAAPEDLFLRRFIEGHTEAALLRAAVDQCVVRFPSKRMVEMLPAPLPAMWQRAVRAVTAAMFKHEGLAQDLWRVYRQQRRSKTRSGKGGGSLDVLKDRFHVMLSERVRQVAVEAQKMQMQLLAKVQSLRDWNQWYGKDMMKVTLVGGAAAGGEAGKDLEGVDPRRKGRRKERHESLASVASSTDEDEEVKAEPPATVEQPLSPSSSGGAQQKVTYSFSFGPPELCDAYRGQAGKLRTLCQLKGVQAGLGTEEACNRLFVVLNRERATHQAKARRLMAQALEEEEKEEEEVATKKKELPFHMISEKERKCRAYEEVLSHVISLADALLLFTSAAAPPRASSSSKEVSTGALTSAGRRKHSVTKGAAAGDADSDSDSDSDSDGDAVPLRLGRTQSELPTSKRLLPARSDAKRPGCEGAGGRPRPQWPTTPAAGAALSAAVGDSGTNGADEGDEDGDSPLAPLQLTRAASEGVTFRASESSKAPASSPLLLQTPDSRLLRSPFPASPGSSDLLSLGLGSPATPAANATGSGGTGGAAAGGSRRGFERLDRLLPALANQCREQQACGGPTAELPCSAGPRLLLLLRFFAHAGRQADGAGLGVG